MTEYYLNDWAVENWQKQTGRAAMMDDFDIGESEMNGVEILLASYLYADYSGDAFVLFRKDGKLYEVNGSHCSCYGLEGQWKPEETSVAAIRYRMEKGYLGRNWDHIFDTELNAVLNELEAQP